MKNQLIPPPELAPPSIRHLPVEEKVALWAKLVDDVEGSVLAYLRDSLGSESEAQGVFIEWLNGQNAEHDRAIALMITNLRRRERAYSERMASTKLHEDRGAVDKPAKNTD